MTSRRILLLLLFVASSAFGLSVEEAYQAIPHGRTVFMPAEAKMSPAEIAYLQRLFDWIDQAIVAKVATMQGNPIEDSYDQVWMMKKTLKPPTSLEPLQSTVEASIQSEYAYFKSHPKSGRSINSGDPNVQAASGKAHDAYNQLMAAYPHETAHNKQAFFDYLCALDFL